MLAVEKERPPPPLVVQLSAREREVLSNAALGSSNKEIAHTLGLAHSTVRVLLTRAARKLGASNRPQLKWAFFAFNSSCNGSPAESKPT